MQLDNKDIINQKFAPTEDDVVLEIKPLKGYIFLREFLPVMLISSLIILSPFIYYFIMGETLTFYIGLVTLIAIVLMSILWFFWWVRRIKYIITKENLQIINGNGTEIICPLKALKIVNEDKLRNKQPRVGNIIINSESRRVYGKRNHRYSMILGGADADIPERQGKIRLNGILNPVEVCDILCKDRETENIENYKEQSINTEVIAKKSVRVFTIWIVLGIILIVLFAVSLVALIIDGFDLYFLFMCIGMGVSGFTAIVMGIRNKKLPLDLIAANEEGFNIITTGEFIPYFEVYSVETKYYNRLITITAKNGYKFTVYYVAEYKQVKLTIARKVKEKTGYDILIL